MANGLDTDVERKEYLKDKPRTTPEGKDIIYYQPSKKPRVEGVQTVDPKTGRVGGSYFLKEHQEKYPEQYDYRAVPRTRPELEGYQRYKEKVYEKQIAKKEAEYESKRITEGKIKAEDVVLTQPGAAKELQRILAARKEVTPTTSEEFQRELFRKQRILETLEKQDVVRRKDVKILEAPKQDERTFLVSEKFMGLWEERKPEMERILEREAGLKALREQIEYVSPVALVVKAAIESGEITTLKEIREVMPERTTERDNLEQEIIDKYKEIISKEPSLEKLKEYYPALVTNRKEMEEARKQLKYQEITMGTKKGEWLLTGMAPSLHPVKTALIIGAVTTPILGLAAKVPIIGTAIASKVGGEIIGGTLLGLYGASKTIEAIQKVEAEPYYYKRPSGYVELGLSPITELAAFGAGAAVSGKGIQISGRLIKRVTVRAGIKYKTGEVVPKPIKQIGKGKPPKPDKVTLIRSELETKIFKGKPIKEYIRVKTWGLLGKRTVLIERVKPEKITGIRWPSLKKSKFSFEWVGKKAPPLKEAVSFGIRTYKAPPTPPKKYDIVLGDLGAKPSFDLNISTGKDISKLSKLPKPSVGVSYVSEYYQYRPEDWAKIRVVEREPITLKSISKGIVESYKEKPLDIEIIKTSKKKVKALEIIGLGTLKKSIKSQLATFKAKPISFKAAYVSEYYKYRPEDWAKIRVVEREPITFKTMGRGIVESYKEKPLDISFKMIEGMPKRTIIIKDFYKPYKPSEFIIKIPKIIGAEITRRELGVPLKFRAAKLYGAKGLIDVRYFSAMKDYSQMKIPSKRPPSPKELEMYYFKRIVTETGVILGIRATSYPFGVIRELRFEKPVLPIFIAKPKKKASEIFKARPPEPLPKGAVVVSAGRQKLIQITEQVTKQVSKTEQISKTKQVSKQVQKQKLTQTQMFALISRQALGEKSKLSQFLGVGDVSVLGQALGITQITKQAQVQEQKQVVVSLLGLESAQALESLSAQAQAQQLVQPQIQIQEQVLELETPLVTIGILEKPEKEKGISIGAKVTPKEQGYDVMVREGERRKDKFKRVAKNLPRHKALRKGKEIVDNYIEATYRIRKSGKKTNIIDDPMPPNLSKFRRPVAKSKLPRDSLIELKKHRLDSLKEKQQISYFREQAAKKKRALQQQITFIKTQVKQKKKQQLQSIIVSKKTEQINFIKTQTKQKKSKGTIKFL